MNVTLLTLVPPPAAEHNPKVTPELLASALARYSRSNKGIETILESIDWDNPEKSVDSIFRFVDYGHASIAGLTGGIAMTVDDCSMLLAYKIFEIAQLCDGQESSTRYLHFGPKGLCDPEILGIPGNLQSNWTAVMTQAFELQQQLYAELDAAAREKPELVRVPEGANEKVAQRLRKNFALDRSRYLIPLATKTNAAYVMTARVWAQTIRELDSLPWPEARQCASLLREKLSEIAPRLVRHSNREASCELQGRVELLRSRDFIREHGVGIENVPDQVDIAVDGSFPQTLPCRQSLLQSCEGKANRYARYGEAVRRLFVRCTWNNVAMAELRDLNRHRSGYRFSTLEPVGFYLPPEIAPERAAGLLAHMQELIGGLAEQTEDSLLHPYGYLLGVQSPYEHSMHGDKFFYEVELRTGMGAHFRYAEHLEAAFAEFSKLMPEAKEIVEVGTAEPE